MVSVIDEQGDSGIDDMAPPFFDQIRILALCGDLWIRDPLFSSPALYHKLTTP